MELLSKVSFTELVLTSPHADALLLKTPVDQFSVKNSSALIFPTILLLRITAVFVKFSPFLMFCYFLQQAFKFFTILANVYASLLLVAFEYLSTHLNTKTNVRVSITNRFLSFKILFGI